MGVASLVLGIISVVIAAFFSYIGWLAVILGVGGIVLGAVGRKNGKGGVATAGMVLSIIGVALGMIFWIACAICAAAL